MPDDPLTKRILDLAARCAIRGIGDVEPNPPVGAVVVGRTGEVIGMGHHRRFGGAHAEVEALADCRRRGADPRGSTLYVTLEPCAHEGKTPPCTRAIIDAGIARVVAARPDPNPASAGGAAHLSAAGINVEFSPASAAALDLAAPFVKTVTTGLPWVTAKWAQTLDGRIADRDGNSKWISCARSRRRTHLFRARVDAVMTGAGTIAADNPLLTARGVPRLRRVARRVVIDGDLSIAFRALGLGDDPLELVKTVADAPVTVFCRKLRDDAADRRRDFLEERGLEVIPVPCLSATTDLDLAAVLRTLHQRHGVWKVLVEAGRGLLTTLFLQEMVDEAVVFTAPRALLDHRALTPLHSSAPRPLAHALQMRVAYLGRSGEDTLTIYRATSGH